MMMGSATVRPEGNLDGLLGANRIPVSYGIPIRFGMVLLSQVEMLR
jgi:hypothetical protein